MISRDEFLCFSGSLKGKFRISKFFWPNLGFDCCKVLSLANHWLKFLGSNGSSCIRESIVGLWAMEKSCVFQNRQLGFWHVTTWHRMYNWSKASKHPCGLNKTKTWIFVKEDHELQDFAVAWWKTLRRQNRRRVQWRQWRRSRSTTSIHDPDKI